MFWMPDRKRANEPKQTTQTHIHEQWKTGRKGRKKKRYRNTHDSRKILFIACIKWNNKSVYISSSSSSWNYIILVNIKIVKDKVKGKKKR